MFYITLMNKTIQIRVRRGLAGDVSYMEIKPSAKVHIMGICGTAMSSLAGLLKGQGYLVCGSDRSFYPPISEELKRMGIPTLKGYKKENIHSDLDLVIVGNVISKNMPETQALLSSGLPYITLPEALNSFVIKEKNTIMVCGTHGKTTVSCLLAWVLNECGLNPGFMIGGVAENFNTGFHLSDSNWFVVEGDEYDTAFFEKTPKCVHYHSQYILLNNIEFDHADIYKDIKDVEKAFHLLLKKQNSSLFIACIDSPLVKKLISSAKQRIVAYGVKEGDWSLIEREALPGRGQVIHVVGPEKQKVKIQFPFPGEHNALNVLSVWVLSQTLNLDQNQVISAFKSFKGVRRRFQVLGEFSGITLIEDFAHHPTAVSSVLQSAREMYPERRILAVFEPRSNTSRKSIFQEDYQRALSVADLVFCMEAYNVSGIPESEQFSAKKLVQYLSQNKTPAFYADNVKDMVVCIQQQAMKGDVVIIMSNGDFGGIYSLLKEVFS